MTHKILTLFLLLVAFACDQKIECKQQSCVKVKLVKELCGQAILKILDPAYYDKGQSWTDGDGVNHENVFLTLLPCNISDNFGDGSGAIEDGQEFYIQFADSMEGDTCARCKALLHGPEKFNHITIPATCEQDESI